MMMYINEIDEIQYALEHAEGVEEQGFSYKPAIAALDIIRKNEYGAGMMEHIEQLNILCEDFGCTGGTNRIHWLHEKLSKLKEYTSDDVVLMPKKITAENGMKYKLIGEYKVSLDRLDENGCEYTHEHVISWPDMKRLYDLFVTHAALPK